MGKKDRPFPVEILTAEEVARLLKAPSSVAPTGVRNRAIMVVMYRSGLRVGEALALKVSDIDPAEGTIRILHGKGDKARTVAIDDGGLGIVNRWIDRRAALGIKRGPLFCTLAGGEMSPQYTRAMMHRYARRAGIDKRVHPHALRHTNACEMAKEGVPVATIQRHLGHGSLQTTDIYLRHVAPAEVIAMGRSRTWNLED